jgi:hypothetical protein
MARIRALKPGFFKNHDLFMAEKESGLPLRLAYEGLWCVADREGRFKWKPHEIKTDVLPYDDVDMAAVLDALARYRFIIKYKCTGEEYGFIPTFLEHQHVNKNEAESTIPAPPKNSNARAKTVNARASTVSVPSAYHEELVSGVREQEQEGKGTEEVGAEVAPRAPRLKTSLPDNFPDDEARRRAQQAWTKLGRVDLVHSVEAEMAAFRDHHLSHATRSADWPASWRTWVKNTPQFTRKERANGRDHETTKRTATDGHLDAIASLINDTLGHKDTS